MFSLHQTNSEILVYFFTFSIHAVKLKVLTYILIIPYRSAKNPKYYPEVKSTFIHVSNNFLMNYNVLIAAQGVGKTWYEHSTSLPGSGTLLRRIPPPRRPVNTCFFSNILKYFFFRILLFGG